MLNTLFFVGLSALDFNMGRNFSFQIWFFYEKNLVVVSDLNKSPNGCKSHVNSPISIPKINST